MLDYRRRTPRQVALNFLARHPHLFVIPKSSRPEHTRENAGGAGWELTPEDLAAIDRAFPAPDHDVPLGMIWQKSSVQTVAGHHPHTITDRNLLAQTAEESSRGWFAKHFAGKP